MAKRKQNTNDDREGSSDLDVVARRIRTGSW
jgi:hypothetical protein